ncbi:MAG: nitroreductase family protein [Anaerolineae bacterium]
MDIVSPDAQAVLSALRGRRSIRHFAPQPVPRALLEQILQAATWAPSASNTQPWRFVVFQGERKGELALRLRRFVDELQPGLNPVLWVHRAGLRRCAEMIEGSAATITAWATLTPEDARVRLVARGDLTVLFTWTMVVQSVAAAVQNLLIAAHSLGLGAVWLGYPNLAATALKAWLGEAGELVATVALGYPAEVRGERKRKTLASVVRWEG